MNPMSYLPQPIPSMNPCIVYLSTFGWFSWFLNVGKSTSPMDGMGKDPYERTQTCTIHEPTKPPISLLLMEEILHKLRLVVYPIIYRECYIPGGCLEGTNPQGVQISLFSLQIGLDEFSLGGWTTPPCASALMILRVKSVGGNGFLVAVGILRVLDSPKLAYPLVN